MPVHFFFFFVFFCFCIYIRFWVKGLKDYPVQYALASLSSIDRTNCMYAWHSFIFADTSVDAEHVTLPICTKQHLCKSTGCSNDRSVTRFCYCDMACTFYNDCCVDYKDTCSSYEDEFQEILASRDIRETDLQCFIHNYRGYYWMITTCNKDLGVVKENVSIQFAMILCQTCQLQTQLESVTEMYIALSVTTWTRLN